MCGLVGWIGNLERPPVKTFELATDILRHRGPDDRGIYQDSLALLGHRRLSIIDLSEAGRQPMVSREFGSVIVFNGEIYNYIELRDRLKGLGYVFHTETDTEVLHAAYDKWGPDCLAELNGMFAFAVWDQRRQTIFLARDRFGVKPLYYGLANDSLVFGSEPKALLCLRPEWRHPNWATIFAFLQLGSLHASENSFYDGIKALPPAHYLTFRFGDSEPRIKRFWQYPLLDESGLSGYKLEEEFADLFDDSVSLRLRSDVPVGVTLSGGLDSSAILASAVKRLPNSITCFTSVFPELKDDEGVWAKKVAAKFCLDVQEVHSPAEDWVHTLGTIAWHMDSPGYSPAVYPLWCLMLKAKQLGVSVLLEGQGADEELAGYSHYAVQFLIELVKGRLGLTRRAASEAISTVWGELNSNFGKKTTALWMLRELFPWLIAVQRRRTCAGNVLRRDLVVEIMAKNDFWNPNTEFGNYDRVSNTLWQDHSRNILPGLLHYGDSISMAHSVEARQPFLDYRLVEWLFRMPTDAKIKEGRTKWVLRRYLEKNNLGFVATGRRKVGYLTPEDKWLREGNYALPKSLLLGRDSMMSEYCSGPALNKLIAMHRNGAFAAGNHLYRLISCELWARSCLTST